MTVTRRRFLSIAASFAATPVLAQGHTWSGRAFGADVSIELNGPADVTTRAVQKAQTLMREVEGMFSLYDPTSDLAVLNMTGEHTVPAQFETLMQIADVAHTLTDGLFDPTIQPLWRAIADGNEVTAAQASVGWDRVDRRANHVRLGPGQALTFNGIAQGFATDLVADTLRALGFTRTLVNIGEYRGAGGPWRLGVADPQHGLLATRTITDMAVATSSPMATPLGEQGHIVHATQAPHWSTVTVEAETAAMADALSTGLVLADRALVDRVRGAKGVHRITLVDPVGNLATL